jgi:hypothetical protein
MQAVYRLGKITSKYIILDILGHSYHREEAGKLLMATSSTLRRLLEREFSLFLDLTVREQAEELQKIAFNWKGVKENYFYVFTPAATSKLCSLTILNQKEMIFLKQAWKPTYRVEQVCLNCTVTNEDLLFIFEIMKPRVFVAFKNFGLTGKMETKHTVMEIRLDY